MSLQWLAGLLDADGSIGLERVGKNYTPYVSLVSNTNPVIVEEVKRIAKEQGWNVHVLYDGASRKRNARPCWQVRAKGKKASVPVLSTLVPLLVGKKAQAELVLEWCQGPLRRTSLSDRDTAIVDNVRSLNATGLNPTN
jgi:hypothetical protein